MCKDNKKLICGIMLSLLLGSSFAVSTALGAEEFDLEEYVVYGNRATKRPAPGGFENDSAVVGILGDQDVMRTPFVVHSLSEKTVGQMVAPGQSIDKVLSNVPSVRTGTSPIKSDFSIRGILTNASSMKVNNVPGFFCMASAPVTNTIESVDIFVGPAATLNGSEQSFQTVNNGTAGSILLTTKKAKEKDFVKYKQSVAGYGYYGNYVDISQRFGKERKLGLRINGEFSEGGLSIREADERKNSLFANIDYRDDSSKTNLFGGYYDAKLWGTERRFNLSRKNTTKFPDSPYAKNNFDHPGAHQFMNGYMVTLNHEKKLSNNSSWFVNAGLNQYSMRRFIYASQIDIDQDGNVLPSTYPWSDHILMKNQYVQTGIMSNFKTGAAEHNLSLAIDRSHRKWHKSSDTKAKGKNTVMGNIFSGLIFANDIKDYDVSDKLKDELKHAETDVSINIVDKVSLGKLDFIGGITRKHTNYKAYNKKMKVSEKVIDDNWAPTYGINYAPTDKINIFMAHAEAMTRGTVVSGNYDNDGEMLDPQKTKSNEVGVKIKIGNNASATLSYFEMTRPNSIEVDNPDGSIGKLWKNNGENKYKGVDFSISGEIAPKWNAFGGFEYLDGRQKKTDRGKFDGCHTDGSNNWSGVAGIEYKPDSDTSIMARINYMGTGFFIRSDRRELKIPSYTTLDLFASRNLKINGLPVKLSAICYNVFDKNHWVAQAGQGSKFMINLPRSFVVTAEFDI